jgi:hypothetical protein
MKLRVKLNLAVLGSRASVYVILSGPMANRALDYFKMGDAVRLDGRLIQPAHRDPVAWDVDWLLMHKTDYLTERADEFV